jgi:hypothetical protein
LHQAVDHHALVPEDRDRQLSGSLVRLFARDLPDVVQREENGTAPRLSSL